MRGPLFFWRADVDVGTWLRQLGLEQYEQAFIDNAVDADVLPRLTADDLKEIGVSAVGHRRKLLDAIATLRPEEAPFPVAAQTPDPGRRQVTVLFADLAGYTVLSRAFDPEEVVATLDAFFECVDRIVHAYGGHIDKHIGDCVMAVFGAPIAHGDDAERAIRAAIAVADAVPRLPTRPGHELAVHAGISSGHVVASETGSAGHREYTVTGESVSLASRLTDLARPGEILTSDLLYRELTGRFDFAAAGRVSVEGFDEPVRIWRVLGLSTTRREARPLVGRRAELQQLRAALSACREAGSGQTIYVRGEAGIGKTRIVEAFQRVARDEGFRCHTGLVLDFGVGAGRDAIRMLVRGLLDLHLSSSSEAIQCASAEALGNGLLDAPDTVFLNDLLGLPQSTELRAFYDAMDNAARNQGKRRTVRRLVERASRTEPRVLVVEDLHWADNQTVACLAEIALAAATCPILLVVTSRPEGDGQRQAWRSQCSDAPLTTIDLGPLSREDARSIAKSYVGVDAERVERCVGRAAGNPLFLDQLLRHATENADESMPGSIQSIVQARLDRLGTLDRAAVQAASVLGQRFDCDALRFLLQQPDYVPDGLVRELLVRPQSDAFLFAHALIRDAVYEGLLKTRRRALHRRAAQWFGKNDPILRAEHLERAEDPEAAGAYLAALEAEVSALHYEHALALSERGLALATSATDRQRLGSMRGELLRELGRTHDAMAAFRQIVDEATDDIGRSQALIGVGSCVRLLGGFREGMDALDEAESCAPRAGAGRDRAQISYYRGCLLFAAGEIEACLAEHELAFARACQAGDAEWQARALSGLGDAYYGKGRMRTAIEHFLRCRHMCQQLGFGRIEVGSLHMIGTVRRYLLECHEAIQDLRAAVEMTRSVGNLRTEMVASTILGELLVDAGNLEPAYELFSGALAIADTVGNQRHKAYILYELGRALWHDPNRRAEAQGVLRQALTASRETDLSFIGPRILAALAMAEAPMRRELLDEGEALIRAGCLAHNALWFYRDAIEASLNAGEWQGAVRIADRLSDYTRAEPLPWADFFIKRGHVLASLGQGTAGRHIESELRRLQDQAAHVGLCADVPTCLKGRYASTD
jgi:class 3 adenylate cyclase/tetratricopeptide (TPR) repeat protein